MRPPTPPAADRGRRGTPNAARHANRALRGTAGPGPAIARAATAVRPATALRATTLAAALVLAATACGPVGEPVPAATDPGGPGAGGVLTVYSGRSEALIGPILAEFEVATGIALEIRYAGTSELAATILEEGAASPADLFLAQDAGALGALAKAGLLRALPDDLAGLVAPRWRAADGSWVGITGRARVLAYDTRELAEADLPDSVLGLADPAWAGRVGWVPTNASFQTFVTALRLLEGDAEAGRWLAAMAANGTRVYDGNAAAVEAVRAGEIDVALVNHYYAFEAEREAGAPGPVANHYFRAGDPGALVNVAGAGIVAASPDAALAERLIRWLLDEATQRRFAEATFEYPLRTGIPADPRLPPLESIEAPGLDLTDLDDLDGTLRLLAEAGVL